MWDVPRTAPTVTFAGFSLFILLWDVLLAGQIAQARRQQRDLLAVTALCGLLVAPGAVIAIASTSVFTGRTLSLVSWLWPATLALFVAQSGLALERRLVTSLLSAPIFAFNVLLFVASFARAVTTTWPDAPAGLLGVQVAHVSTMGLVWDLSALWSPLAVQLPLLSPAYPARWRVSKTLRAGLAIGAAGWTLLAAIEYPSAVRAVASFDGLMSEPLQARPRGDLALGLRILPALDGPPPAAALERDLPLADSLGASVLAVVVIPAGTGALALDSLAASLAGLRRDSVLIAVSLGYGPEEATRFIASPAAWVDARLALVDRVVRRLRPDVLFPAADPLLTGRRVVGEVPVELWRTYHRRAADLAHLLRPRTQVGVSVSAFTSADSVLYAWAASSAAIDVVGFSFAPTFRGGGSLAARQRVAERWMAGRRKPHWVISVRSYPYVFGESAQLNSTLGTFAWASRQPRINTVIVDGAGDYDALTGLQRADGGLRPAVAALARAQRAMQEAAQ